MTKQRVARAGTGAARPAVVGAVLLLSGCGIAFAETRGVVELFTSQACSSCPPADAVLSEIAADPSIVALSFSVDYWDYLGWKDIFAKPEFSKRQRGYAEARGDRAIYTPQVVVNGRSHVIGSDRQAILAKVADDDARGEGMVVDVSARIEGDRIIVKIPAGDPPATGTAAVWIASYMKPTTVEIGRGENAGHEVSYTNVVERWQVLGMWNGEEMTVELPISDLATERSGGCAVVLQSKLDGKPGPILGAAKVDFTGS